MKANELMVGDWVKHPVYGGIQVRSIPNGEQIWTPIPLTAEILEKNFPNADKVAWWFADDYEDADDRITYEIHISGGALGINGFMWYVHELQHALRLCGLTELADNFKV